MDIRIKFFVEEAIPRGLMTKGLFLHIIEQVGKDIDLIFFAQILIKNDIISDISTVQELIKIADQRARESIPQVQEPQQAPQPQAPPQPQTIEQNTFDISNIHDLSERTDEEVEYLMHTLLQASQRMGASDLHLSANSIPFVRVNLNISQIDNTILSAEDSERLNMILLNDEEKEKFKKDSDLDTAIQLNTNTRIRTNIMLHKDGISGTYRMMPNQIKPLEELGFSRENSKTILKMLDHHNGLILVAGPLGSGKTTTLAALIKAIDAKRREHIITVEDPIEIVQKSTNCNITQRQIGNHTNSFSTALKGSLREDPDIIVIGELRDLETIEMAITASETGHLVIGTLHTNNASNTLNRIIDVFPPSQQQQIRAMTAGSLRGIICQQLIPTTQDTITIACEILVNYSAISNLINDGKIHLLKQIIETGSKNGMCTMDQSIYNLYTSKKISKETSLKYVKDAFVLQQIEEYDKPKEEYMHNTTTAKIKGWFK